MGREFATVGTESACGGAAMTRELLDAQLGRMVVLRGMPGDSGEYWEVFAAHDETAFSAGVSLALKTRTWFPVPAELRMDCQQASPAEIFQSVRDREPSGVLETHVVKNPFGGKDITVTVDRSWSYYCDVCSDMGRRSRWCGPVPSLTPWQTIGHCDRRREHGTHEWVERCTCAETNPSLRRKREQAAEKSPVRERA